MESMERILGTVLKRVAGRKRDKGKIKKIR
jgi:hypothetical protein